MRLRDEPLGVDLLAGTLADPGQVLVVVTDGNEEVFVHDMCPFV